MPQASAGDGRHTPRGPEDGGVRTMYLYEQG